MQAGIRDHRQEQEAQPMRKIMVMVALAGVFAAMQPAFADQLAAAPSDRAQAATSATEQPAPPAAAWSSASETKAPASTGLGKDVVTVGFGWG
jgi:hypothetical protein